MPYLSQHLVLVFIHGDSVVEVWIRMSIRFSDRVAGLDERTGEILRTLAYLGGYWTVDQAQRLGLANSPTRVQAQLKGLERAGFLRQVASYPLVYQITKSVTRLVGSDLMARRIHPVETVHCRLLAVNFYLEAAQWPAEFIFDHEAKVEALQKLGCPVNALPHRGSQPYLWESFVLDPHDGGLCVTAIDRADCGVFRQALGLAKRFAQCRKSVGDSLSLVVAVSSGARHRLYSKVMKNPLLTKHAPHAPETVSTYQVSLPVPSISKMIHDSVIHSDNSNRGDI